MKATRARSVVKNLSINLLIERIKKACGQNPRCFGYFTAFATIKLFIDKFLRSWVMLKHDIPGHTCCDDLGRNHLGAC